MSELAKFAAVLQTYGPWGIFGIALIDSMGIPLPSERERNASTER